MSEEVPLTIPDITWVLSKTAYEKTASYRTNKAQYAQLAEAFRLLLLGYINANPVCGGKQGRTISPIGAVDGIKRLKVRFNMPGSGRSGALRLVVAAHCERRVVKILEVFRREDDPDDAEFLRPEDETAP